MLQLFLFPLNPFVSPFAGALAFLDLRGLRRRGRSAVGFVGKGRVCSLRRFLDGTVASDHQEMKKVKSAKAKIEHENGHALPFKFAKLLDPDASWDKDQLGDVLHWIRQVVGLVCGLICGAIPLVGAIWILVFLVLSSGIIYGYYANILKIDEEEFGGHGTLLQEGLFASFSLFLLAWILVYSLAHF